MSPNLKLVIFKIKSCRESTQWFSSHPLPPWCSWLRPPTQTIWVSEDHPKYRRTSKWNQNLAVIPQIEMANMILLEDSWRFYSFPYFPEIPFWGTTYYLCIYLSIILQVRIWGTTLPHQLNLGNRHMATAQRSSSDPSNSWNFQISVM